MDWSRPTTNTASTSDSVLSQQPQTQKAKEMDPMDYLATRFEENQSELRKLRDELAQAKADLSSSRSQINEQKDGIAAAVKRTENQRHQIRGVNEKLAQTVKEMNSLRRENVELRTFTKNQAATVNNIRAEMLHEEAKRKDSARGEQHALAAQKELQTRLAEVQSRLSEALFEIEHFKCIEAPVLKIKRDLLPQPFVLVLVDGDAYGVSILSSCIAALLISPSGPILSSATMLPITAPAHLLHPSSRLLFLLTCLTTLPSAPLVRSSLVSSSTNMVKRR